MVNRGKNRPRAGCGTLFLACFITCVMLVVNGTLVAGILALLGPAIPRVLQGPKVTQLTMFIVPVMMIFVEWRLIDMLVRRLRKPPLSKS